MFLSGNRSVLNSVTIDYVVFSLLSCSLLKIIRKKFLPLSLTSVLDVVVTLHDSRSFSIIHRFFTVKIKVIRRMFLTSNIKYSKRRDLNERSVKVKFNWNEKLDCVIYASDEDFIHQKLFNPQ